MKIKVTIVGEYEVDSDVLADYKAIKLTDAEIVTAEKDAFNDGDISVDDLNNTKVTFEEIK